MSTLKRFFKDTVIYGLATVLPRVMGIILVRLHTDALPTEGYSGVALFYVGAAFLNIIFTLGMETAFFRFFAQNDKKDSVYSTTLITLTISTILGGVLVFTFRNQLATILDIPAYYLNYLLGIVLLDTLVVAPFAYLRARGKAALFTGIKMINLLVFVGLNFFFLWAIPKFNLVFEWYDSIDLRAYIFIANLAASAITLVFILPQTFKVKLVFDKTIFKKLWEYGWPVMVAGIAFAVIAQLDKWFVNNINKDIGGAYAACYKLAVFMTIFIQAFRLGAEPFFFNQANEKNAPTTYAVILKYFVIVGSIGFLLITIFVDLIKEQLVNDSTYHIAMEIVPYILLANLFLGIYHNLAIWYKLTDQTKYGMYFSILGALVALLINLVFIPVMGFMAAALSAVAAFGTMMVVSYFIGRKKYPIPYEMSRICAYLIIATVLSFISFYYFRANYWISAILLGVFVTLVFVLEKEQLKQILKS